VSQGWRIRSNYPSHVIIVAVSRCAPGESSLAGQIRVRSSLENAGGEYFLSIPEFKKDFILGIFSENTQ
jgi:hypothetical protein